MRLPRPGLVILTALEPGVLVALSASISCDSAKIGVDEDSARRSVYRQRGVQRTGAGRTSAGFLMDTSCHGSLLISQTGVHRNRGPTEIPCPLAPRP